MIPYLNERNVVANAPNPKFNFDYPDKECGFIPECPEPTSLEGSPNLQSKVIANGQKWDKGERVVIDEKTVVRDVRKSGRKDSVGVRLIEGGVAISNQKLSKEEQLRLKVDFKN